MKWPNVDIQKNKIFDFYDSVPIYNGRKSVNMQTDISRRCTDNFLHWTAKFAEKKNNYIFILND